MVAVPRRRLVRTVIFVAALCAAVVGLALSAVATASETVGDLPAPNTAQELGPDNFQSKH